MQNDIHTDFRASLTQVAKDVWVYDDAPIGAAGLAIPVRMSIVRLSNGNLILHSPVRYSRALHEQLDRLGGIQYLLAPNIAHWMFLADWQAAVPAALTFAAPGLASRSQVRKAG